MKKAYILTLALVLSISTLAGCGKSTSTTENTDTKKEAAFKDGTYKGTYDKADKRGWKPQIEIVVEGGKITKVDFDNLNKDGKRKTQDDQYEENMKKKNGLGPKEYTPKLNQSLVTTQDASKVETVTGATQSSKEFKDLSAAVLQKAKSGDKSDTVLQMKDE